MIFMEGVRPMKRVLCLCFSCILLCTACSSDAVQNAFQKQSRNMLEVTLYGETYDLRQDTATVLDKFYVNNNVALNYMTMRAYGAFGKFRRYFKIQDITDRDRIFYFKEGVPEVWKIARDRSDTEAPREGIQQFIYGFFTDIQSDPVFGSLASFATADGISKDNSQPDLSAYISTDMYGYGFGNNAWKEDKHYLMVTADGAPVDVAPYLENMPAEITETMEQRSNLLEFVPMARYYSSEASENRDFYQRTGVKEFYAVVDCAYDQMLRLNAQEIEDFAIIDLCYTHGQLTSVGYIVYKYDSFSPVPE